MPNPMFPALLTLLALLTLAALELFRELRGIGEDIDSDNR